ncbi:MAG: stage II sporulation protein M [Victivallaceae bacterium]
MILNIRKFIAAEQPFWLELETLLEKRKEQSAKSGLDELRRFNYLYERIAGDLVKLRTFSGEKELQAYLEGLAAAAYAEIYAARPRKIMLRPLHWLFNIYPRAFRAHFGAFLLALAVMSGGAIFGGVAVTVDPQAHEAIIPAQFSHLQQTPKERVAEEEKKTPKEAKSADDEAAFAMYLINNNIKVSIMALAFGVIYGIGTIVLLFYNGVLIGAIVADYVNAGCTAFVAGWLLPHGVFEIPAILVAAQAGLVLAGCLLRPGGERGAALRLFGPDIIHLAGGFSVMLIWAGIVEAFMSQHHAPVFPYAAKIAFGMAELAMLIGWLGFCGRPRKMAEAANDNA